MFHLYDLQNQELNTPSKTGNLRFSISENTEVVLFQIQK